MRDSIVSLFINTMFFMGTGFLLKMDFCNNGFDGPSLNSSFVYEYECELLKLMFD